LGGDEFGVLIYNCDLARAERLATQLRDVAHDYRLAWDGETYQVGASIGVVGIDADSGDLAAVMRAADMACYQSKAAGRGRISIEQGDTSHSPGGTALAAVPETPAESRAPLLREMMLPLGHGMRAEVQRVVFWPSQSVEPSWAKLPEWHAHLSAGADSVAFDVESVSACLRWLRANADDLDMLDFVQLRVLGGFLDNAPAFDKVSQSLAASGLARNLCLEVPATTLADVAQEKLLRLSKWGCSLCAADAAFDLRVEGLHFLQFDADHFASALSSQNTSEQMRARLRRAQSAGLKLQVVNVTDVRSLSALQDLGVDLIAGAAVSEADLIDL
ncbi:MAG: diguanylate cyclase, partial [Pseudomonadota bacterium]